MPEMAAAKVPMNSITTKEVGMRSVSPMSCKMFRICSAIISFMFCRRCAADEGHCLLLMKFIRR